MKKDASSTSDGVTSQKKDTTINMAAQKTVIDETELDFTPTELVTIPHLNLLSYATLTDHLGFEIERLYKIPKLVPIAQSAHESRYGNSDLARKHCNLFGIVATDSWKAKGNPIALMPTWEEIKGKRVDTSREFRAYSSWKLSFMDWASIITGLSIYKKAYHLFQENRIVEGITEMAKIYATDSAYARKLIDVYSALDSKIDRGA